jgi:hypothetical protein
VDLGEVQGPHADRHAVHHSLGDEVDQGPVTGAKIPSQGDDMPQNVLYLAVLPLVHISNVPYVGFGLTESVMTLFPDKRFATEFTPGEVDNYISTFKSRADQYLVGNRVVSYEFSTEPDESGRYVIVRVTQNVSQ